MSTERVAFMNRGRVANVDNHDAMQTAIAWVSPRGGKYWPAPNLMSCALRGSQPSQASPFTSARMADESSASTRSTITRRSLSVHPGKARLTVLDFVGNHKVFARRLETLLRAGGERAARLIELLASDGALELPAGCLVELELEAKQLLREIAGRRSAVEELYRELRAQNGDRPSAGDLQRMGYRPGTLRARYGSWFEFVESDGDLTAAEAAALPTLRTFLRGVETTQMTKCFKAVTLAVLSSSDDPFAGLPLDELALRCREMLERRPELWEDVVPAARGEITNNAARNRWLSYWRRNPIAALIEGDTPPLCRLEHERLVLNCPRAPVEATKAMLAVTGRRTHLAESGRSR